MSKLFGTTTYTQLDWDAMQSIVATDGNPCYLVALDELEILVLSSVIREAEWFARRWVSGDKDTIDAFVSELELCLMSGCNVQELVATNRMVVAALVGEVVDLSDPLPETVDFSVIGVGPRISELVAKMEEIRALQESLGGLENTDFDDIEEILDGIGTVLGAAAILGV